MARAYRLGSLRRGRATEVLHAEEVGAQAAGPVLRRYVSQVRVTAPFFDAKATDPEQKFAAEAHSHPVFRLTKQGPPQ